MVDFFTLQDKAKRQTRALVALFCIAVILILLAINGIFYVAIGKELQAQALTLWLQQPYWIYLSISVVAIILITSMWRSWQLNQSPDAIARLVKATPLEYDSQNVQHTQLKNIVEEMSIASGTAIPKVYVMSQEQGINAFVAGTRLDAVTLVVTQGLLDNLNREQIQAVIAHEYSHIFHGDMQFNVRLIGILAGILVIGEIGQVLLRSRNRGSSRAKSNGNAGAVMLFGLGLFIIGYIGLFFGRLIKAAISRQREFLADASAVQYTRNNRALSSALAKISQHKTSSILINDKAEEMSHMCFAKAIHYNFNAWFATHPPIEERIKAIDVGLALTIKRAKTKPSSESLNLDSAITQATSQFTMQSDAPPSATDIKDEENSKRPLNIETNSIVNSIGQLHQDQILLAQSILQSIPQPLLAIARGEKHSNKQSISSLEKLLIAFFYSVDISGFKKNTLPQRYQAFSVEIEQLTSQLKQLSFRHFHCLLDVALASFSRQARPLKVNCYDNITALASQTQQLTIKSFLVYALITKTEQFKSSQKQQRSNIKTLAKFSSVKTEITLLLSLLLSHCSIPPVEQKNQLKHYLKRLGINNSSPIESNSHNLKQLALSLSRLSELNNLLKKVLFEVCIDVIEKDNQINIEEFELLRIIGLFLGCPVPICITQVELT
ncbi:M48 family metallopeptidase [Aliikangiella sp. IMCC44653]